MVSIKDIKQQALHAYKFDMKRNVGVEFIAFMVKFALIFALATVYIICLAKLGSEAVSMPVLLIFTVAFIFVYLFAVAPINLGRNLYFTKVAAKTQPQTDDMFYFYKNIKMAVFAYFRIAIAMIFYTVFFAAITIVYFKIYALISNNWFSPFNVIVCLAIIIIFAACIINTRLKYSLLPVVYQKFNQTSPIPFVAKTLRCSKGIKAGLFYLHLNFAGWYALGFLTLGIGFFWIMPYIRIASKIYLLEKVK